MGVVVELRKDPPAEARPQRRPADSGSCVASATRQCERRRGLGDEAEGRPALHLDRLAGVMGEHEHRRVVGRLGPSTSRASPPPTHREVMSSAGRSLQGAHEGLHLRYGGVTSRLSRLGRFSVSRVTCQVEGVAVRHSRSVTRAIVGSLAAFVGFAVLACGVAQASITLFEPPLFHPGSVNGQSGVGGFPWKSAPPGAIPACVPTPTNGQYDQEVVANTVAPPGNPPGFGSQSLRMSNACASSEFFYQTYSAAGASTGRRGAAEQGVHRRVRVYVHDAQLSSPDCS